MFALAAGGISAALLAPSGVGIPSNVITAGHLQVRINQPDDTALSLDNLAPGEHRFAYQLVTGDMSGVATADLDMTLFSAGADSPADPSDIFARHASLAVAVSAPEPERHIRWSEGVCAPTTAFAELSGGRFTHLADMPHDASAAAAIPLGEFTGDAASEAGPTVGNNAVCVRFDVGLDASAGNEVQATSGGFSMSYSLTQTAATS
jgi:hypothetical protein